MKTYEVTIAFSGRTTIEVEAKSEEEALKKVEESTTIVGFDEWSLLCDAWRKRNEPVY